MSINLSITRTSERIIRFLEEQGGTNHYDAVDDFLPVLQTVQKIFPQCVLLTCPVHHTRLRFITENCARILNITPEFFKTIFPPRFLYAQVHEDDQPHVHQCFLFIDDFLKNRLPEEYPALRFALQYRYRQQNGNYITLNDEKCVLNLSDGGAFYYTIMKDITEDVIFSGVRLDIYKQDITLKKIATYKPYETGSSLSKRETEVVGFLKRGLTTKEIAYRLNISEYTVRNIKQKMFEKYKANNVIELLNKTVHYN